MADPSVPLVLIDNRSSIARYPRSLLPRRRVAAVVECLGLVRFHRIQYGRNNRYIKKFMIERLGFILDRDLIYSS
jgi:hypothetical protein